MYYPDLTVYEYLRSHPSPFVVNVGWLARGHAYNGHPVSEAFVAALEKLAASPVNLCRGSHSCDLCPASEAYLPGQVLNRAITGNGEIHVVGKSGVTYVAPVLIVHYVKAHGYQPPQEFIDSVLSLTLPKDLTP